ncbi:MAG: phage shock protein C [Bacteroidia bacterium]|jgi:phage shock protein C
MSGKKLARKQGKIFGVCAGLGEHFELDATVVRIGFILFSLLGGSGVLLYLILTLVMPKAY